MSFEWTVDAQGLFGERYPQMVNSGLPVDDVDAVRAAVSEMWPDAPGGWVYEWSALGARYAGDGAHRLAALAYGFAKFPVLADDAKCRAQQHQLDEYLLAAPGFGVDFERKVLELPYRGGTTPVPVHLFATPGLPADAPVMLASGGTDSWKMDMHGVFVAAAQAGVRVLAFDVPGTGESSVPFTTESGEQIVRGLIAEARSMGAGAVLHLGISFGGFLSARTGLAGEVDGAIVIGSPIEAAWTKADFHYGMNGIVGNMLGFDALPSDDELLDAMSGYSLRPLLDQDLNAPMLVLNGADDVHVPQHDTLVFEGRRDTEVHLIPDTGHCATSKFPEAAGYMFAWLQRTLTDLAAKAES